MKIEESKENYLETILVLKKRNGSVRSIDIATEMNFSKPSVSVAMKNLKANGLITVNNEGNIELSTEGLQIADAILERHTVLTEVLISIGVPEDIAAEDACRIEHDINEKTFEAIKKYFNNKK